MSQKSDFLYYLEHQDGLVKYHNGKVLAIKDGQILGEYDSELAAISETCWQGHEKGSFIVQRCSPGETDTTVTINTPRYLPMGDPDDCDPLTDHLLSQQTQVTTQKGCGGTLLTDINKPFVSSTITSTLNGGNMSITTTYSAHTTMSAAEHHKQTLSQLSAKA